MILLVNQVFSQFYVKQKLVLSKSFRVKKIGEDLAATGRNLPWELQEMPSGQELVLGTFSVPLVALHSPVLSVLLPFVLSSEVVP